MDFESMGTKAVWLEAETNPERNWE